MKSYQFRLATEQDSDGTIEQAFVERQTIIPKAIAAESIKANAWSGPYFQPDRVEVKELARDIQNRLIDEGILDPTLDPPLQNMIREVLENFLAKQFHVNLERSRT